MRRKYSPSIQLFFKLFVVLALPFFLFRYVSNQDSTGTKNRSDEGTRTIAIVNEDLAQENETEDITFGGNIPDILSDQTDYSWLLMSRSAAEEGFANQRYDAVLYIPSNFTRNILNFKSENPSKAIITYMIEPNLEAKEHQRIYRQLANAKNTINQEMSSIYWSYVSQEVDNLKGQFDKILEKEIAFQDAMSSFYQPSSKTLVDEIDQHRNQLVNILEQTRRTDETVSDAIKSEITAQERISQFAESLEMYKDSQESQVALLNEFQRNNQESLQRSIINYETILAEDQTDISNYFMKNNEQLSKQQANLNSKLATLHGGIINSQNVLDDWRESQEFQNNQQKITFENLTMEIVDNYTDQISKQFIENADNNFNEQFKTFNDSPSTVDLINPIKPAIDEEEKVEFAELKAAYTNLSKELTLLKELLAQDTSSSNPDSEDLLEETPTNVWDKVDNSMRELSNQLNTLEEGEVPIEALSQWIEYAEALSKNYDILTKEIENTNQTIIEEIEQKQQVILDNQVLSVKKQKELESNFTGLGNLTNKSTQSLANYSSALTSYNQLLNQSINIDRDLVKKIIAEETIQNQINKLFMTDQSHVTTLENTFGIKNNDKKDNISSLINQAEQNLITSTKEIEQTMGNNKSLIDEMYGHTDLLLDQVNEINQDYFEWEESSVVSSLEGELLFQVQNETLASLDSLSNLIGSLDENQNNITVETTDLQETVRNVQEESTDLNERWTANITNTEYVRDDAYNILGNTVIDGQLNPYVYDYLSNPVILEGQINGEPLYETENRLPPVILFIIILLSGLLIGFLTQYYSNLSYFAQGGLFVLLTLAVGLIISIYGLNIYTLNDSQTILWSAFTILLLMASSNIIRAGLFVGPFIGWITSILMILFFVTPMLNIIVAEFNFNHPIANVYINLLHGSSSTSYAITMISLILITLSVSALIYGLQIRRKQIKVESRNEETA